MLSTLNQNTRNGVEKTALQHLEQNDTDCGMRTGAFVFISAYKNERQKEFRPSEKKDQCSCFTRPNAMHKLGRFVLQSIPTFGKVGSEVMSASPIRVSEVYKVHKKAAIVYLPFVPFFPPFLVRFHCPSLLHGLKWQISFTFRERTGLVKTEFQGFFACFNLIFFICFLAGGGTNEHCRWEILLYNNWFIRSNCFAAIKL